MSTVPSTLLPPVSTTPSSEPFIEDYEAVRRSAYARVEALGLRRRWVARQIDRSVRCVSEVLRGTDTGAPTLALIVALLSRIESGEVVLPEGAERKGWGARVRR